MPDDHDLPLIPPHWTLSHRVDGTGYSVAVYIQPGDAGLHQVREARAWEIIENELLGRGLRTAT